MTAERMGIFKVIARSPERFRGDVAIYFIGYEIKLFSFHNAPACLLLILLLDPDNPALRNRRYLFSLLYIFDDNVPQPPA
jgi:hypothetical protein